MESSLNIIETERILKVKRAHRPFNIKNNFTLDKYTRTKKPGQCQTIRAIKKSSFMKNVITLRYGQAHITHCAEHHRLAKLYNGRAIMPIMKYIIM